MIQLKKRNAGGISCKKHTECAKDEKCRKTHYDFTNNVWSRFCARKTSFGQFCHFKPFPSVTTQCDQTENTKIKCIRFYENEVPNAGRCLIENGGKCLDNYDCASFYCNDGSTNAEDWKCQTSTTIDLNFIAEGIKQLDKISTDLPIENIYYLSKAINRFGQSPYKLLEMANFGTIDQVLERCEAVGNSEFADFVEHVIKSTESANRNENDFQIDRKQMLMEHLSRYFGAGDLGKTPEERMNRAASAFQLALQNEGNLRAHYGTQRAYAKRRIMPLAGEDVDVANKQPNYMAWAWQQTLQGTVIGTIWNSIKN